MADSSGFIYLLQEREFIILNQPIYKIGRTSQHGLTRFYQYPKNSKLILYSDCIDCVKIEKELINLFNTKFKKRNDIGNEYFEGNKFEMKKIINELIEKEENEKNEVNENANNQEQIIESNNLAEINQVKKNKMDFSCSRCKKKFRDNYNLNQHLARKKKKFCKIIENDNIEKTYACKFCNKNFTTYQSMNRHLNHYCINKKNLQK